MFSVMAEAARTRDTRDPQDSMLPLAGMNACVGMGRIEEASSILKGMQRSGLKPDVRAYNVLLKGLAGAKDMEAMQWLLEDMRDSQVSASVITYNIVVDAFAKEGRLAEVRAQLHASCCRACAINALHPLGGQLTPISMSLDSKTAPSVPACQESDNSPRS